MKKKVEFYTDGSSDNKYGKGGCAAVMLVNGEVKKVFTKKLTNTMSGGAEVAAILLALENVPEEATDVVIYSDSEYCINTIKKGWLENWIKKGKKKKNMELWRSIRHILSNSSYSFDMRHVKGHNGNKFNEIADQSADYNNFWV